MQILNVQQLKKEFGDDILFEDVSFSLNDNDRLALIGPNGNGKSTLIKIILNEVDKTSGEVVLAKGTTIGYLSQDVITNLDNNLYDEVESVFSSLIEQEKKLKEMEDEISLNPNNVELIEEYGIKQNDFLEKGGYNYHYLINMMLSKFGFYKEDLTRTISSFSGGERTKIAFVKLLLIKPNLLILDEPINGLDPEGIIEIRKLVLNLNKKSNITILISSHYLDELSKIATNYGFIDKGHIVEEISYEELNSKIREKTTVKIKDTDKLAEYLDDNNINYEKTGKEEITIYNKINIPKFITELNNNKIEIEDIKKEKDTLENYFLKLLGGENE